ncbi:MAG: hypothetical protein ACK5NC_11790 [Vibrio sp.]
MTGFVWVPELVSSRLFNLPGENKMLNVQPNQTNLIKSILNSGRTQPETADALFFILPVNVSKPHFNLVLEQLLVAGLIIKNEMGKYITTIEGERMEYNLNTIYSDTSQQNNNM